MRRAQDRARSARSRKFGARSATIKSRALGALKLVRDENVPAKRADFLNLDPSKNNSSAYYLSLFLEFLKFIVYSRKAWTREWSSTLEVPHYHCLLVRNRFRASIYRRLRTLLCQEESLRFLKSSDKRRSLQLGKLKLVC